MTKEEAVNWIINLSADIGKSEHSELWHYEQALYEIREMLESEQQWIPVTERLPETSEKVLITRRFGLYAGDDYDRCIDLGYYYSNLNQWVTLNLDDIEVLAWMPLPEPYKEVDE